MSSASKITDKMSWKGLGRALDLAYSLDIIPCDFWAFRTIQGMIEDRHLQDPEELLRAIQEAWTDFIFEQFQNAFKSWIERLTWVIANNGEYCHYKTSLGKWVSFGTLRETDGHVLLDTPHSWLVNPIAWYSETVNRCYSICFWYRHFGNCLHFNSNAVI
jgi:hypothetical protein